MSVKQFAELEIQSLRNANEVISSSSKTEHRSDLQHPKQEEADGKDETDKRIKKSKKKWNRRFKLLFCCMGYKKNKDSIADVASIFAEFYSDLSVPSSDLAAGFVLLSKYQSAQRQWILKNHQSGVEQYLSSVPITSKTNFLDISTAQDSHLMNDLIYYMNYSLAIFGWPMQLVDDPCMLCCICPYLRLSSCFGGRRWGRQQATISKSKIVPSTGHDHEDGAAGDDSHHEVKKEHGIRPQQQDDNNNTVGCSSPGDQAQRKAATGKGEEIKQTTHKNRDKVRQSEVGKLDENCDFPIILEDNFCGCNVASIERRLASHNCEIIYASYKVDVNVVPFFVAADHSKQSVVVALRGSMSISDMITDMNGTTDKLPLDNCPDDWLCHRGITRAANYVKTKLLQEHILDTAFECRPDLGSQNYDLILCGHSLGAGVAAILGILLRPHYPSLKAYLYSPPGGILSLPAVEYTKEFAIGIILGTDCVPRLGVAQLERLRYHILLSLKSSQKSTSKILAKALCPTCCLGGNKVDYDPSQSLNLLHGVNARSFDYNGSKIPFQVQPQVLYVPGRLIHILKNHNFKSKARRFFNEPIYQAIWNENITYDRVLINEGMLFDHLPNNLMHAMKMLFSKTLPARKDASKSSLAGEQVIRQENILPNWNQDCLNEVDKDRSNIFRESATAKCKKYVDDDEIVIDANNNDDKNTNTNTNTNSNFNINNEYDQKRIVLDENYDDENNNSNNNNDDTYPDLNKSSVSISESVESSNSRFDSAL